MSRIIYFVLFLWNMQPLDKTSKGCKTHYYIIKYIYMQKYSISKLHKKIISATQCSHLPARHIFLRTSPTPILLVFSFEVLSLHGIYHIQRRFPYHSGYSIGYGPQSHKNQPTPQMGTL